MMKEKKNGLATAEKLNLLAFFAQGFILCIGFLIDFNIYVFGPLLIGEIVLSVLVRVLRGKEKDNDFKKIVSDMKCVEKETLNCDKVISDQEILLSVKKFIHEGKASWNLVWIDKEGKTLLIHAARYGRAAVVKYMLDEGIDVQTKDYDFFSALHAGVMSKNVEIVRMLLEAGAEVNAKWNLGTSPIMLADYSTDLEIFRLLMAYGADPNQQNQFGVSAMDMFANSPEIFEILNQRE